MTINKTAIFILIAACLGLSALACTNFGLLSRFFYYNTYYFLLAICLLWVLHIVTSLRRESFSIRSFFKDYGPALIFPWLVALLIAGTVKPYYNVPSGEMLGVATSKYLMTEKTIRSGDVVVPVLQEKMRYPTLVSFRPVLLSFLTAIIHTLTGYRASNVFLVNFLLMGGLLSAAFLIIKRSAGSLVASASIILIASCPVFSITARSAGFDLLNAFLLGFALLFLYRYMKHPDPGRFGLLWTTLLMLAYVREESFMYLFLISAGLAFLGYWRWKSVGNPVLLAATPLLLWPILWLRIVKHGTYVGQPSDAAMFNSQNLLNNAAHFLSQQLNFSFDIPYNTPLHWLALLLWGWFFMDVFVHRRRLTERHQRSFILIATACLSAFYLAVFIWAWDLTYTFSVSYRFYIILEVVCALAPAVLLATGPKIANSAKISKILLGTALCSFFIYHPIAVEEKLIRNPAMCREADYIRDFLNRYDERDILVVMNTPFRITDQDVDAVDFWNANQNFMYFASQLKKHAYRDIIVVQRLMTQTSELHTKDILNPGYDLETIEYKKTSPYSFCRISRVKEIRWDTNPPTQRMRP